MVINHKLRFLLMLYEGMKTPDSMSLASAIGCFSYLWGDCV